MKANSQLLMLRIIIFKKFNRGKNTYIALNNIIYLCQDF